LSSLSNEEEELWAASLIVDILLIKKLLCRLVVWELESSFAAFLSASSVGYSLVGICDFYYLLFVFLRFFKALFYSARFSTLSFYPALIFYSSLIFDATVSGKFSESATLKIYYYCDDDYLFSSKCSGILKCYKSIISERVLF